MELCLWYKESMLKQRKCIGCGELKNREDMIRLTKEFKTGEVIVNQNPKIFGRSAYLCYNQSCIDKALKKNRINRVLKTNIDLKGLLDEQFKS